jgi:hypothetical protein
MFKIRRHRSVTQKETSGTWKMQLTAEKFPPVYIKFPHTEIRGETANLTAVVTAIVCCSAISTAINSA